MDTSDKTAASPPPEKSTTPYIIGIVILFVLLIGAIAYFVFSFVNYNKSSDNVSCATNYNCSPTQYCGTGGVCQEITCSLNSDCPSASQECAYQFCYQSYCASPYDCESGSGTGQACINNLCVNIPTDKCNSDNDCWGGLLKCSSGVCVQCVTNSDCPGSQSFCASDGICYNQCTTNSTVTQGASPCPSGNVCVNGTSCCPSTSFSDTPTSCDSSTPCPSGQFCVKGVCTCVQGDIGDTCLSNTDCLSNNCLQGYCTVSGAQCLFNYGEINPSCSDPTTPYCVNGKCQAISTNSPCSCTITDGGSCTQYNSCIVSVDQDPTRGSTGTISFCLKETETSTYGICRNLPGWVGAYCFTSADCSVISGQPNCSNGRCI